MNEVRIYKPFRKTAVWASWTKDWQEAWVKAGMDPDRLVLDDVISPSELNERGNDLVKKYSNGTVFKGWRNMAKRPLVKCLYCGEETENANKNGIKEFCSLSCGVNYRYLENKLFSEEKIGKERQSGQGQIQSAE